MGSNLVHQTSPTSTLDIPLWERFLRRVLDLLLGAILFGVSIPLWLIVPILIKTTSDGPVLVRFNRLGRNRTLFPCFKFRTMYVDSDQRLNEYLRANRVAAAEWEHYRKLRGSDPRVTSVGKWLRISSLDEIPQVLNILRGDMSIVGPRPYLPNELSRLGDLTRIILSVKPGLTGKWQISGRNQLTFEERVQLEADYVRTRTIVHDLLILFKTPVAVLSRRGAS